MASGDREKPQCRVCKTVFTFKGPEPLLLPCLHPVCKPCVDSKELTITCDTCQQMFDKTDHSFPKHFLLAKDLYQSALKNSPSDITCTYRNHGGRAETWCPQCEAFLCKTCREFHKDTKGTRSHVVESLQSYLDQGNEDSKMIAYCDAHQDHPLGVFDASCGYLVCYKCLKVDHSTCNVLDIEVAFDEMKESELDDHVEQIVSRLDEITEIEQEAQDLAKKLDENSKNGRDEIINTFSDLRKSLDMREKVLLQETSQSFQEVQNVNKERIEVLKREKTRCEAALRFIKRSKEISDPVQALMMKTTIDKRTTACTEADLMEIDARESSISLSTQDLRDVKHSINTFAGLYSVYDEEDPLKNVISESTTQEQQHKKLIQLQNEVKAFRETLNTIPRLIDQGKRSGKIGVKIPGVSTIKRPCTFDSKIEHFNNMPWYLSAEFKVNDGELILGLYLCPSTDAAPVFEAGKQWTCKVKAVFEIHSSLLGCNTIPEIRHCYSDVEHSGFGYYEIISKKQLQEPLSGYLQDDCANVSVDVEILNTTGVLTFEELMKKKCSETLNMFNQADKDEE